MTLRHLPLLLVMVACGGEIGITGDVDSDGNPIDPAVYDGATLRIISPASASFLPLGEQHDFVAEVRSAEGELLDVDGVGWGSNIDTTWTPAGTSFVDSALDVGVHDLTATVELPNGDRLAHTVGGVLVQAESAGTYVGVFTAGFDVQGFPVSCSGSATLVIEPRGEAMDGTASCLASAGGFDIPLDFVMDGAVSNGSIEGTAAANIVAFPVEFPSEGTLQGEDLELTFGGPVFTSNLDGSVSASRISRDTGL